MNQHLYIPEFLFLHFEVVWCRMLNFIFLVVQCLFLDKIDEKR